MPIIIDSSKILSRPLTPRTGAFKDLPPSFLNLEASADIRQEGNTAARLISTLGEKVAQGVDTWLYQRETAKMVDAEQSLHRDLSAFDEEYRATRKGEQAFEAVKDYETFFLSKAGEHTRGISDPRVRDALGRRLEAVRLGTLERAKNYQIAEEEGWRAAKIDGYMRNALAIVSDPAVPPEQKQSTMQDYFAAREDIYPGDHAPRRNADDQAFATAMAQSEHARFEALRAEDPQAALLEAKAGLEYVQGRNARADAGFASRRESGAQGSLAIGYDPNGGTSYGLFQISSKTGTFDSFMEWLDHRAEREGGQVCQQAAARLRDAGAANTGSTEGSTPEEWKKLVAEGLITDELQEAFIRETHVDPALKALPKDLRALVEDDKNLSAALFSTAVQHGSPRAAAMMTKAWSTCEGDTAAFLSGLYEERAGCFLASDPEQQSAVAGRLQSELQELLAGPISDKQLGPLGVNDFIKEMNLADGEIRRRAAEAFRQQSIVRDNTEAVLAQAMLSGDFKDADALENLAGNHNMPEAGEINATREVYEMTAPVLKGMEALPFEERRAGLENLFQGQDGAQFAHLPESARMRVYRTAQQALYEQQQAYAKDPMRQHLQELSLLQGAGQQGISKEMQVDYGLAAQQRMVPGMQGRVTTNAEVQQVQELIRMVPEHAMNKKENNDLDLYKLQQLSSTIRAYGKHGQRFCEEAQIPASAAWAARVAADDASLKGRASELLHAALLPEGNVEPKVPQWQVSKQLNKLKTIQLADAMAEYFINVDGYRTDAKELRTTFSNFMHLGGQKQLEKMDELYNVSIQLDGCGHMLQMPKSVNSKYVMTGLKLVNDKLEGYMEDGVAGEGISKEELLHSARQKGMWINSQDGQYLILTYNKKFLLQVPTRDILNLAVREHEKRIENARKLPEHGYPHPARLQPNPQYYDVTPYND